MLCALAFVALSQTTDLDRVHKAVSKLPGVVIEAESVKSGNRMTFRIAPGGHFAAKYATSETFYSQDQLIIWVPARQEYSQEKASSENPLPLGFDSLWPTGPAFKQNGESHTTTFQSKEAIEIPSKNEQGLEARLYVDPKSLLPMGMIAVAQGKEYVTRFFSVKPTRFAEGGLDFKPPKGARPFSGGPQEANRLIHPGAMAPSFSGKDLNGKDLDLAELEQRYPKGLVLNFWFASCVGCIDEMPYMVKLSKSLSRQQFGLIGVNAVDDAPTAKRSSSRNKLPYPTLLCEAAKKLAADSGIVAYPVTLVVDPKGVIVDAMIGFDQERLEKALETLGYKPD